jgi:hypothetical protein
LVSGLWHGAAMTFVVWGAIHGLIIVLEKAISKPKELLFKKLGINKANFSNKLFSIFITFTIVCFAWVFFRANTFADSQLIISGFFTNNFYELFGDQLYLIGLKENEFTFLVFSIFGLIFIERFHRKKSLFKILNKQVMSLRWGVYIFVGVFIILFGVYGETIGSEFIYFQF